jgi:transaldolase
MQNKNLFERLTETHPELEIWWDSSPIIYDQFCKKMLSESDPQRREVLQAQFRRMYDPDAPERSLFRGVTTNPPLSLQAIEADPARWEKFVDRIIRLEPGIDAELLFWKTYREMVRAGAELYRKIFEASRGKYGYISGQVDPRSCFDEKRMMEQALDLASLSPNVMIKIPGTREGYRVIEQLTARGIATNNTLSFIVPQMVECAEAVVRGLKTAEKNGVSLERFRSVITHMSARFTSLGDLGSEAKALGIPLSEPDLRWAELALFKKMCRLIRERNYPSKMLICSMMTGPDNEDGKQLWHLQKLSGGQIIFTCPPPFIEKILKGYDDVQLVANGIDEEVPADVLEKLLKIPYFRKGYDEKGLTPDEFNEHSAVKKTAQQHREVTEKMVNFVRSRLQKRS